jgi:hypothetical protein
MAYGLLINNSAGTTVIDTSTTVLNFETVSLTSTTVPASGTATVTVEGADVADTVLIELTGSDAADVTTSATATDTYTLTNTTASDKTVGIEFWRLK